MNDKTKLTDAESLVRRAYHAAEGTSLDLKGFSDLFAHDGVIHAGEKTFRGEQLPFPAAFMAMTAPDVHRELHRVHVMGNVVAVIRGTFSGAFESPAVSSRRTEPSLKSRPLTSGTSKTAKSRSSTATSSTASCSSRWAFGRTSRPQSEGAGRERGIFFCD